MSVWIQSESNWKKGSNFGLISTGHSSQGRNWLFIFILSVHAKKGMRLKQKCCWIWNLNRGAVCYRQGSVCFGSGWGTDLGQCWWCECVCTCVYVWVVWFCFLLILLVPNPVFLFALKTRNDLIVRFPSEGWCAFALLNPSLFWSQVGHSHCNVFYLSPH